MLQRMDPGVMRFFLITTACMIFFPIAVLYISNYLTRDFNPGYKIVIGGISSVIALNMVIAAYMFIVYKTEIKQKTS
ncbi:hypothetical protein SteCoe_4392 [Stentor coeruleus]|uniref:Vacuolar ATPase assembly integral membrane protein VMA21 homolog n=1 Tax=Stentor coeruleus TaxID=5963 RepID=A0A1R2CUX6_9CILI|nr:hypothetical protein SteCoe_4392 [Stentor coeruleus]